MSSSRQCPESCCIPSWACFPRNWPWQRSTAIRGLSAVENVRRIGLFRRVDNHGEWSVRWEKAANPRQQALHERCIAKLHSGGRLRAIIEPGNYPNRIRYQIAGRKHGMRPLPRERYWTGEFGPPRDHAETCLEADLRKAAYYVQANALRLFSSEPRRMSEIRLAGVEEGVVEDLVRVGLVHGGVNLRTRERTYRLSALGQIIQERLESNG